MRAYGNRVNGSVPVCGAGKEGFLTEATEIGKATERRGESELNMALRASIESQVRCRFASS